jgi:hypothetical protein
MATLSGSKILLEKTLKKSGMIITTANQIDSIKPPNSLLNLVCILSQPISNII